MKIAQIILILATLLSGIGMAAVRLGYVVHPILYAIIFFTLVIGLAGNAILALINLKKQKASTIDPNSASDLIRKALDLACITMSSDGRYNFRATVFMRCKDDKNKICVRYHSSNMDEAKDRNMSLDKWQGCAGQAWGYSAPIVADLTLPEVEGGSTWGLTPKQIEQTHDLGTILAIPVRPPDSDELTIAILGFDTEEAIADLLIKGHHKNIALEVASQIGLLLSTFHQIDPL